MLLGVEGDYGVGGFSFSDCGRAAEDDDGGLEGRDGDGGSLRGLSRLLRVGSEGAKGQAEGDGRGIHFHNGLWVCSHSRASKGGQFSVGINS